MSLHPFAAAALGGALIAAAASLLLLASGRIAGVSGILGGLLVRARGQVAWRAWFVAGLLIAGVAGARLLPGSVMASPRSLPLLAVAGVLVGVGTRLANGCTSGHGVCGMSRLSPRSLVATPVFTLAGMTAVALLRALGVGP